MATHPSGETLEILGIECGTNGRTCECHPQYCGEVVKEDVVLRLRKVQVVIDGIEETAIAAFHVSDAIDQCRVGFLGRHLVRHWMMYEGVLVQVVSVYSAESDNKEERKKFHRNLGCCKAGIISVSLLHRPAKKTATDGTTQTDEASPIAQAAAVQEVKKAARKPRKKKVENKNDENDEQGTAKLTKKPKAGNPNKTIEAAVTETNENDKPVDNRDNQ
jgi:hypothetical protein